MSLSKSAIAVLIVLSIFFFFAACGSHKDESCQTQHSNEESSRPVDEGITQPGEVVSSDEPASLSWEEKDAFWATYAPEDTSPVPLDASNCWTILSDEEGYVYGEFDGSFCAMKKKDYSHIIGFRVRLNDDGTYEINYNTGTEWYYEQFDSSAWQMHDGISQKYIYETLHVDKDNRFIMFEDRNDNEDLFLMDKAMLENYIEFMNLSEQNRAQIMKKYGFDKAEDFTARETAMLNLLDSIKSGEFKQEISE